jgi:hydrogenase maturation protease
MNQPVRIIAWGNDGRCDDGAGLALIDRLRGRVDRLGSTGHLDCAVRLDAHHQLGPEVAADVAESSLVFFVDAHVAADRPAVFCERVKPSAAGTLDSHHCSPATLVTLCESLGWPVPPCYLVGIRAHNCEYGDTLSARTRAYVDRAVRLIEQAISAQALPQDPRLALSAV